MPMREPDLEDPMERVGVRLPVPDDTALREMAECFAEEFLRMGHSVDEVKSLFRNPFYGGPHEAYRSFGEEWTCKMIENYGRIFGPIGNR
jgi:hypothetical protein